MPKQLSLNHFPALAQLVIIACSLMVTSTSAMNQTMRVGISEDAIPRAQRLPQYALNGNIAGVKKMLSEEVPINAVGMTGYTALHAAAHGGYREIVSLLLQHDADIDVRDKNGLTPLHLAALAGNTSVAELLLNFGADINAVNTNGSTPLLCAATSGHAGMMRLLCERNALLFIENKNGFTPLQVAAEKGSFECVRILLEYGAFPAEKAIAAAQKGRHYEILALLLLKAQIKPTPEILKILPHLHKAAVSGLHEVVHYLCAMKCYPVDEPDANGFTALHLAVAKCDIITINRLIDAGADPNRLSANGHAALHLTVDSANELTARILIARKANVNVGTAQENRTPLHFAALTERESLAKLFIENGALVDAVAEDDNTAVHFATHAGAKTVLTLLAKAGADLNAHRDKKKRSEVIVPPPQNAHLLDMRDLLAQLEQDMTEPGSNETALHMAVGLGKADLIEHLLSLGADARCPSPCRRRRSRRSAARYAACRHRPWPPRPNAGRAWRRSPSAPRRSG